MAESAQFLEECPTPRKKRKLQVDRVRSGLSRGELQRYIVEVVKEPVVFLDKISQWQCMKWTPASLAKDLTSVRTRFRFCPRVSSPSYGFAQKQVIMETDCDYLEGTFQDFYQWLTSDENAKGLTFQTYPRKAGLTVTECSEFWHYLLHRTDYSCYADYKYMIKLFGGYPDKLQDVDWTNLGFSRRHGDQSTFWMGSKESFTPCHYDTYGCNLVAQIYGKKRWTLFPPSQTNFLYPTRMPYEESSVFSQVNVKNPDLEKFPCFGQATCYEVILEPGDVLFVPKHWWHFVESLDTSISINTWIEMESDSFDRIQEAVTRALVYPLKAQETGEIRFPTPSSSLWMNPSMREEDFSCERNISFIRQAIRQHLLGHRSGGESTTSQELSERVLSSDDIVNIVLSSDVIQLISQKLLQVSSQATKY